MAIQNKRKRTIRKSQSEEIRKINGHIVVRSKEQRSLPKINHLSKDKFMLQNRKAINDFINLPPVVIKSNKKVNRKDLVIARLISKFVSVQK